MSLPFQFRNLLKQTGSINRHYKEIAALTGENFNVFRILKLQSSEVRLHSTFLAELLNPKGSHGQKETFLKLFVDNYQFKENGFDVASATIEVEKYTGAINENYTEGGRIDIILTDKYRNKIIIENKIYAGDEKNQLVRYNHYSLNADLFYLTLDGKIPTDRSSGELIEHKDYKCLSYSKQITEWLERCRKEVSVYPTIRETLTQYLYLIKHLTNQTMNNTMTDEIASLVASSSENTEAAFTIMNTVEAIKEKLLIKFKDDINAIADELNLKVTDDFNFKAQYNGVYFFRSSWKGFSIAFQFQSYSNVLLYGILLDVPETFPEELREKLISIKPNDTKSTVYWPFFRDFEYPYYNWNNSKDVWTAVNNGVMKEEFRNRVIELLELIDRNAVEL